MKWNQDMGRIVVTLLVCLCFIMGIGLWVHDCIHDCSGEDCVICKDILLMRKNVCTGDLLLLLIGAILPMLFPVCCDRHLFSFQVCDSPVLRKVKLTI